ncbi:hypothetical protein D3C78_1646070 [compost metagenome]
MNPATGGHGHTKSDFAATRAVPNGHFSHTEVAANIGRLDVPERDHHPATRATDGLRRRNNRLRITEDFAHCPAACFVPDSTVFQFTILANDRPFAIGLHFIDPT